MSNHGENRTCPDIARYISHSFPWRLAGFRGRLVAEKFSSKFNLWRLRQRAGSSQAMPCLLSVQKVDTDWTENGHEMDRSGVGHFLSILCPISGRWLSTYWTGRVGGLEVDRKWPQSGHAMSTLWPSRSQLEAGHSMRGLPERGGGAARARPHGESAVRHAGIAVAVFICGCKLFSFRLRCLPASSAAGTGYFFVT